MWYHPPEPSAPHLNVHRVTLLCAALAGWRPRAAISQSSSATVPSRWPAVIWRNDFTATLSGATFPVTTCACRQPLDKDHITDG